MTSKRRGLYRRRLDEVPVRFLRHVVARVPKSAQAMVAPTVRTIFEQPIAPPQAQVRRVRKMLAARCPAVVHLLEAAEAEVLTFYDLPVDMFGWVADRPATRAAVEQPPLRSNCSGAGRSSSTAR